MSQFNPGDTVYDEHGNAWEYIALAPGGGYIAAPIYEQDDGPYLGDALTLRRIYASEEGAIQKRSAELVEIEAKLNAAREELRTISTERSQLDRETVERRERIKQHEKLKLLDDYLAGNITHFVVRPSLDSPHISVKTTQQVTARISEYGRTETKLLTLYGDSKGDLQFKISYYSDGSGSQELVYPFTNEHEAIEFAKKAIASGLIGCMNGNKNGAGVPWALKEWINTADSFGVPVPDNMREIQSNFERKCLDERIEKARAELDRLLSLQEGGAA